MKHSLLDTALILLDIGVLTLVVTLCMGCTSFHKQEKDTWTTGDTIRQMAFTGLNILDSKQTHRITDDPMSHEDNRLLGKNPSHSRINNYFITTTILNGLISYILPKGERELWQYGSI